MSKQTLYVLLMVSCFTVSLNATNFYFNDFEVNNGNLQTNGSTFHLWEWGNPTSGPGYAYSGSMCWATVLAGDYGVDDASEYLTLTNVNLTTAALAQLQFWQYLDSEGGYDGGNIQVSTNNRVTWTLIGDNPMIYWYWYVYGFNPVEPAWSGSSGGWFQTTIDVSDLVGKKVSFRFHFASDGSVNYYPGWYIDDVSVNDNIARAGTGTASVLPASTIAGFTNSYLFTYTAQYNMSGGKIMIDIPTIDGWSVPQTASSNLPGYCRAYPGSGSPTLGASSVIGSSFEVNITTMKKGDTLVIGYGVKKGSHAQNFSGTASFYISSAGPAEGYQYLSAGSPFVNVKPLLTLPFFENFEGFDGNFVSSGNQYSWQWGQPGADPYGSWSGSYCWGTWLWSNYPENAYDHLTTPAFDLRAQTYAYLNFYHYLYTTYAADGGNVTISTDLGKTWALLGQTNEYNTLMVAGLSNQPGWSGYQYWSKSPDMELTAYCGHIVMINFNFGSDPYYSWQAGWYVDDVRVANDRAGKGLMSVAPDGVPVSSTNRFRFTYTAACLMNAAKVRVTIPTIDGWTSPQTAGSNSIGYVRAYPGSGSPKISMTPLVAANQVEVFITNMKKGDTFVLVYGAGKGAKAPAGGVTSPFDTASAGQSEGYLNLSAGSPFLQAIPLVTMPFFANFDANKDYFSTSGVSNAWKWGQPTFGTGAWSWPNCWTTSLNAPYPNTCLESLYTPPVNLAGKTYAFFRFSQWYDTEQGQDGGNVSITTNNGLTWQVITPISNYPTASITGLSNQKGWSGWSGGWRQPLFELMPWCGKVVRLRLRFGSDTWNSYTGWYVDDAEVNDARAGTGSVSLDLKDTILNTTNLLTFTYTADFEMSGGRIQIDIPAGWSVPQTSNSNLFGFAVAVPATGSPVVGRLPQIVGNSIIVHITNMKRTDSFKIVYGYRTGAISQPFPGNSIFNFASSGQLAEPIGYFGISPSVEVKPLLLLPYHQNFESDDGFFKSTGNNYTWQYGFPPGFTQPGCCFPVSFCWGIWLNDDNSPNGARDFLTTPPVDLRSQSYAHLRYEHWFATPSGINGGNISVSKDNGSTWQVIGYSNSYNTKSIQGFNGQRGWSGSSPNWITSSLDLTPFCGYIVLIRFNYATGPSYGYDPGWYIDNICLTNAPLPAAGRGGCTVTPRIVETNSWSKYEFVYTASNVIYSGKLTLEVPSDFTKPQITTPSSAGYVKIAALNGSPIIDTVPAITGSGPWTITVNIAQMDPFDRFKITYGETSQSGKGAKAPATFNGTGSLFLVQTAGVGETAASIASSPTVWSFPLLPIPVTDDFFPPPELFANDLDSTVFLLPNGWNRGAWSPGLGATAAGTWLNQPGYQDGDVSLTSAPIDLSTAAFCRLTLIHRYDAWNGQDGGQIRISTNGGLTFDLFGDQATGPYDYSSVSSLGNEPGFSGTSPDWMTNILDLSAYKGREIMIRFRFAAQGGLGAGRIGWAINNLRIEDMPPPAAGSGTAVISPDLVRTKTTNTFSVTYTATKYLENGQVSVEVPAGFTAPQNTFPQNLGFVSVTPGNGSPIISSIPSITGSGPWAVSVTVVLMESNQSFTITYGDPTGGCKGAVSPLAYGDKSFTVSSAGASEAVQAIAYSPILSVMGVVTPPYFTDLEADAGGWLTYGSTVQLWQRGFPSSGPWFAWSGSKLWATVTNGDYVADSADAYLVSPLIDLTTASFAHISFWHWYNTELGFDGGDLEVSEDGGYTWEVLGTYADGNYLTEVVQALENGPGFSGNSGVWLNSAFDLTSWTGKKINVRFRFATDNANNSYPGWYIDDIRIMPTLPPIAGKGKLTILPQGVGPGSTNTLRMTFTAPGLISSGSVRVAFPLGWSRPTNNPLRQGYITVTPALGVPSLGAYVITNAVLTVPVVLMSNNETFVITYSNAVSQVVNGDAWFYVSTAGLGESLLPVPSSPSVKVQPILRAPFVQDFEADNGFWAVSGNYWLWQWGQPTYWNGPPSANSGSKCWGVNLSGTYPYGENDYLTSAAIDLTSANSASLVYWQWYQTEAGNDGGNISISTDGFNYQLLGSYPQPYNYNYIYSFYNAGFSGWGGYWHKISFDIAAYAHRFVWLRFNFASQWNWYGGYSWAPGWYIDDLEITTNAPPSAGTGLATMTPAGAVVGSTNTLKIGFKAERYLTGGEIRIVIPWGWTPPQTNSSISPGYVRLRPGAGNPLLGKISVVGTGPWTNVIPITTMMASNALTLVYTNAVAPFIFGEHDFITMTARAGETPEPIVDSPDIVLQNVLKPPFELSFETNDGGMTEDGNYYQWAWGTPFNGPGYSHSGSQCWGINLYYGYGYYENGTRDFMVTPIIDLTTAKRATFSFWHWWNMPWGDGANLFISTNFGTSWKLLGTNANPYNNGWVEGLDYRPGWTGGGNYNWERVVYSLDSYVGKSVQVKFNFGSNYDWWYWQGWFIDDVSVSTNPPPVAGSGLATVAPAVVPVNSTNTFKITFSATASLLDGSFVYFTIPWNWSAPQTNVPSSEGFVKVRGFSGGTKIRSYEVIGSGPWAVAVSLSNMNPAGSVVLTYSNVLAPGWYGQNDFGVYSAGPSESPVALTNGPVVNVMAVLEVPFTHSFETNDGGWLAGSWDGWHWGTVYSWFGPGYAHSGSSAWGFKLWNYYQENESGYLLSPVINLKNAGFATLEFWQYYNTDGIGDGGNILISTNLGQTFNLVGSYPENYNRSFIYRLNQGPGWSGWSGDWQKTDMDLTPYVGRNVQLKFQFASDDWDSSRAGWLIDDISVTAKLPPVAGTGTMTIVPQVVETGTTNIFTLTYTASKVIQDGWIRLKIPSSWPNPTGNISLTNLSPGTTLGRPSTSIASWYVEVFVTNMPRNGSFSLVYGGGNTKIRVPLTSQVGEFLTAVKGPEEEYLNVNLSPKVEVIGRLFIPFTLDFEQNNGTLGTKDSDHVLWAWGIPGVKGPAAAHSGGRCWGTVLNGDYAVNGTTEYLTTPFIDLKWTTNAGTVYLVTNAYFTVWQYYDTENLKDGGNISVSTDGYNFFVLRPYGENYNTSSVEGLDRSPGWSGTGTNWRKQTFVLDEFLGKKIRIRFTFGTDPFNAAFPGWYLDDLSVTPARPPRPKVQFIESSQLLGTTGTIAYTYGTASGDLDSDGDMDVITYNFHDQASRVWKNDGSGNFTAGRDAGINSTFWMQLADVDNDGSADAAAGNNDNLVSGRPDSILINDGRAEFQLRSDGFADNNYTTFCIASGDINNDGAVDLVSANEGDDTVWINDGTGRYNLSGQSLAGAKSRAVVLRDFDGDGDLDAVIAHSGLQEPNRFWINDGTGQFTMSLQSIGLMYANAVDAADIDGDGDQDIVFGSDSGIQVWTNSGNGQFGFLQSVDTNDKSRVTSVRFGDADSDGDIDVFAARYLSPSKVYLNELLTRGKFEDSGNSLGNLESTHSSLADVDADGDLDFLTGVFGRESRIWLNQSAENGVTNTPPLPPTSLDVNIADGTATVTWTAGNDTETPLNLLTYNLRVGKTPNGNEVLSVPGAARPVFTDGPGNVGHSLNWQIDRLDAISYYYFSVQTVDGGQQASSWKTFTYYWDPNAPRPDKIKISDNFLNLAKNDRTIISFNLKKAAKASVYIHSITGARVRILADEVAFPAGYDYRNNITWDGTNDEGNKLAPGIYWVVVRSGSVVDKQKILLVW